MADLTTITAVDIDRADKYLTAYLTENIPDADFSEGGVMRDFAIKAIAYIFAFFRNEVDNIRAHNSLLTLSKMAESQSVADAVDAILSNLFIGRKAGVQSHVVATLHFSKSGDVTIVPTSRFFRTSTLLFTSGLAVPLVIPASQLRPVLNADGTVSDYICTVTLIAEKVGSEYNVAPGRFALADPFNPYFIFAENTLDGFDGKGLETTAELLTRSPTALSVRNLINQRSIDATLRDQFSLDFVRVIGMGDPEMMRDYVHEGVTHLRIHLGGYSDIFVRLSRTEFVETLVIGSSFVRPDDFSVMLRDDTIDFTDINYHPWPHVRIAIQLGDVINISEGFPHVPATHLVTKVTAHTLMTSKFSPFEVNTDEIVGGGVTYSVGQYSPSYNNRIAARPGQTSRTFKEDGCVLLLGQPHYRIKSVQVISGTDPVTLTRINKYHDVGSPILAGEFLVRSLDPFLSQSNKASTVIEVHPSAYTDLQLQVTYETLNGYTPIAEFVADLYERVNNTNQLVRGLHPVYVALMIKYATAIDAQVAVDEDAVRAAVTNFINGWNNTKLLSNSEIVNYVKTTFPELGTIYNPFDIRYTLLAPDGQEYKYKTLDVLSIAPDATKNGASLTNGTDLRVPITSADLDPTVVENAATLLAANSVLAFQLSDMGISDRNINFIVVSDDIQLVQLR
jgi:hypothetical protein